MSNSLKASQQALDDLVDPARRLKRWNKHDDKWATKADISLKTLQRFWDRRPIRRANFISICRAIDLEDWKAIVDSSSENQFFKKPILIAKYDLRSDREIDYTQLKNALKEQNWSEADRITRLFLLQLCWRNSASEWMVNGRWNEEKFKQDVDQIPCIDLHTIDHLWTTYSDDHFGFSSQKRIYLEVGGRVDGEFYETAWDKFAFKIGWRQISYDYDQMIFDVSAPKGHLPVCLWFGGLCFSRIALRLEECRRAA
ncbi:MAG: GUN4 domain-containing protein [Myxacorys chilensis ATA2-1-KO14]|jgi:hypothetical protein|nr:GUN4 domain-containing protein [Myxacorys chilensis ATA2-1-KO14]